MVYCPRIVTDRRYVQKGRLILKELIMQNEKAMLAKALAGPFSAIKVKNEAKRVFFAGDNTFICDYLLTSFEQLNAGSSAFSITYLSIGTEDEYRKSTLNEVEDVVALHTLQDLDDNSVVFFFVDCVKGLNSKAATLDALRSITQLLKNSRDARCVVSVLLPPIPNFSSEIETLSEREYSFYIEKKCERTPEIDYYLEVEKACRSAVVADDVNITLARFDNVFAPDAAHTPSFDLNGVVLECYNTKTVRITDEDAQQHHTITYIRSACHAVAMLAIKSRKGHIYNVTGESISREKIKRMIYSANPEVYSLRMELSANILPVYNGLNNLKYKKLGTKTANYTATGIKHLVAYLTGEPYDTSGNVAFYGGKIKRIQALEVKVLQEIDDICRRNGIQYFLAGGTLLGAVRAGEAIPWDDDLDIGMLREDFEKFRKVCPKELGTEYSYSSTFNDSGSHYTIDKVRLDGTYFSTNFSNKNEFKDGIFIDILVYDKTSNRKVFQKLHSLVLTILTVLMEIKWFNKARKKYHYTFSRIFLPLLRVIPWGVFNGIFDFFAKLYRHKKNAEWLIDSVGKKVYSDPLPNKGLDEVVYIDFEGITAPIPADPVPYLTYAYGESYMQLPPFSSRRCPHNFARIDLGKYVFGNEEDMPFREVNVKGELFESEDER